ncbi:MAG: SUMF1/EgtB/PvdO family nonheme iron enzyme [Thermoguttaceae bacterium]|nr:SUMF1/EgtB/PvdO family nonheme iron enzyme [Thermoguttaceae bacterium]
MAKNWVDDARIGNWQSDNSWNVQTAKSCVNKGVDENSDDWHLVVRGVAMFFKRIPSGTFTMGFKGRRYFRNDAPGDAAYRWMKYAPASQTVGRRVRITRDFCILQTQVTIEMFDAFLKATKRSVPVGAFGYNKTTKTLDYNERYNFLDPGFPDIRAQSSNVKMPATCVDWASAVAFCDWLNDEFRRRVDNLQRRLSFRLPTEAEWEYACRAGSRAAYHFGKNEKALAQYGNYDDGAVGAIAGNDGFEFLAQDKDLKPNQWELYNMCGNVWEWCSDWYAPYEKPKRWRIESDPSGPSYGYLRAARGGAWNTDAYCCRSAARAAVEPWVRAADLGFRVVMDVER